MNKSPSESSYSSAKDVTKLKQLYEETRNVLIGIVLDK